MHNRAKFGGLFFFLFLLSASVLLAAETRARNIILMIGDGMGLSQMSIDSYYFRFILKREPAFAQVMNAGRTGFMLHHPASGLVTDSAAGATAFASGIKTLNGQIGIDPEGNAVETILEIAKRHGKKTGLVSTVPSFDATESAFTAHVKSRKDFGPIIEWTFLFTQPDVILGPEAGEWAEDWKLDQGAINQTAAANGYKVLNHGADLTRIEPGRKTYGAFKVETPYQDYLPPAQHDSVTLPEMARAAIETLSHSENGFFLMVEGSAIDLRSHANDAGGILREMADFDRAIGIAYDFARTHDDTLLLITADHETGGMAMIKGASEATLAAVGAQREPLYKVRARLGKNPSVEQIRTELSKATQLKLTDQEAEYIHTNWEKNSVKACGEVLSKYYKIGFESTDHTAAPVALIGFGPGSEACSGWRDNTDVFSIMLRAGGMTR